MTTLVFLNGCSFTAKKDRPADVVSVDSLRGGEPFGRKTITKKIDREMYRERLEIDGSANQARLVQIFERGNSESELKEYRLLDVRTNSVYSLLGLKHADVIVATNGYVVPSAEMFWSYLALISQFEKAQIEIRRNGAPLLLQYVFEDTK